MVSGSQEDEEVKIIGFYHNAELKTELSGNQNEKENKQSNIHILGYCNIHYLCTNHPSFALTM